MTVEYRDDTPFTGDNHTPTELANAIRTKKNGKYVREPIAQAVEKLSNAVLGGNIGNVVAAPTKVFGSLAELQKAYPNGADGVMVTADTGHKYFWQNGTWVDGGVYQSAGVDDSLSKKGFPADSKSVGDKLRDVAHSYNLMDFTKISYGYAQNATPTFVSNNQVPNRIYSWMLFKIKPTDEIRVKTAENFKISAFIYNENMNGFKSLDSSLWFGSESKDLIFSGNEGWLSLAARLKDDSTLSDDDFQKFKSICKIELISQKPKNYLEIWKESVFGERISGSNDFVKIEKMDGYVRTGFVPVKAGEKIKLNAVLGGISSSSNVRGLAGFKNESLAGFNGWIFNNELAGETSDKIIPHVDKEVTIPNGVNFVAASTQFTTGTWQNAISNSKSIIEVDDDKNLKNDLIYSQVLSKAGSTEFSSNLTVNFGMAKSYGIGDCLIFKTPGGLSVMIDAGESSNKDSTSYTSIVSILKKLEIKHVDNFVLTHYHTDHFNGVKQLAKDSYIDAQTNFYMQPKLPTDYVEKNPEGIEAGAMNEFISFVKTTGAKILRPTENQIVEVDKLRLQFINTDLQYVFDNNLDTNMTSLACYIGYGNLRMMCGGDLYWDEYLKYHSNVNLKKCNIYKATHHAGHGSRSDKAMAWFNPEIVVTSLGTAYSNLKYISDERKDVWWSNTTDSIQNWCEGNLVPNYITGFNDSEIFINITSDSWQLVNSVKLANRKLEGIL